MIEINLLLDYVEWTESQLETDITETETERRFNDGLRSEILVDHRVMCSENTEYLGRKVKWGYSDQMNQIVVLRLRWLGRVKEVLKELQEMSIPQSLNNNVER